MGLTGSSSGLCRAQYFIVSRRKRRKENKEQGKTGIGKEWKEGRKEEGIKNVWRKDKKKEF